MPYDYERFEELLKHHLDAMYHDSDEGSEIGENISTFEITSITPTSSGTQSYSTGSANNPITACP